MPACLAGIAKGKFPSFLPKTDETRVQVLQEVLDKYKDTQCYVTEKLDGSSVTYYLNNDEFGVASRNLELLEDHENSLWKVARELDVENKLRLLNKNIALQGELIGEGIQSNKLKIKGQTVKFFNAINIDKYEYLAYEELVKLLEALQLPMVPIITTDYLLENDIDSIVRMATIKSLVCPDAWAEGIVIRPLEEMMEIGPLGSSLHNNRLSFKAINPEFLLKYGE